MPPRRPLTNILITLMMSLLLCFPWASRPSYAAPTPSPAPPVSTQSAGPVELTAADANAWLDGAVPAMLEQGQLPGATVSVVKDGQLLTAKGYGTVDKPNRYHEGATPVDPNRHLFRIGSTSKLFTAVAAMQLVEQGKLDLDADVQQYLDFKLDTPKGPVTPRHLMTHTAGFEEYLGHDFMAEKPEDLVPLAEAVRDMPKQIYEPGTTPAYSNHSTALLGYIVERISGESYADYIDRHILQPLDMRHSSAAQPLPSHLAPDMSGGFVNQNEPAQAFEHISVAPAGSISSTSADMAKFANFALGHGPQIIRPETLKQMQTPALDPAKAPLSAKATETLGLQFWIGERNGVRQFNHGGDTNLFHTMLMVFPDQNVGIFISQNGNGNGDVDLRTILDGFVDRYIAAPQPVGPAIATAEQDAQKLAGTYTLSRQQKSGVLKATGPLSQVRLVANDDGTVSVPMMEMKFRETAPNTWTLIEGRSSMTNEILADGGEVAALLPAHTLMRVPWWQDQILVAALAIVSTVAALGALIAGIVGARQRRKAKKAGVSSSASKTTLWTRRLTPLAIFAPLALLMTLLFVQGVSNLAPVNALLHLAHVFIVIALVAGVAALIRTVIAARSHEGWKPIVGNGIVALAMVLFFVQCLQLNLLQFVVRY